MELQERLYSFRCVGNENSPNVLKIAKEGFLCKVINNLTTIFCLICNLGCNEKENSFKELCADPHRFHVENSPGCNFYMKWNNEKLPLKVDSKVLTKNQESGLVPQNNLKGVETCNKDYHKSVLCSEESDLLSVVIVFQEDTYFPYKKVNHMLPFYRNTKERLRTYTMEWMAITNIASESMATAGFVYTGTSDKVFCFSCLCKRNNWLPFMDPFVEHAKQSRSCEFLLESKGQEFIEIASQKIYSAEEISKHKETLTHPAVVHVMREEKNITEQIVFKALETFFTKVQGQEVLRADSLLPYCMELVVKSSEDPEALEREWSSDSDTEKHLEMDADVGIPSLISKRNELPDLTKLSIGADEGQLLRECNEIEDDSMFELRRINKGLHKKRQCVVCLFDIIAVVVMPCAHYVTCSTCAPLLKNCPVCRKEILEKITVCEDDLPVLRKEAKCK